MTGRAANVLDVVGVEPYGQVARGIAATLSDRSRGRCVGLASCNPEACSARSSVAVASSALMLVHSFQATV
jgi:hypothetical protein